MPALTPYWSDDACTLYLGDCRKVLAQLPEASVDAVVTDPPYEYAFMGRQWDSTGVAFDPATWAACLRVLKPGGHLLAFGAPRTYHRMVCAIEDAGLEIRDSLHWIYGSGFPKSLDVGKAIDKAAGVEREIIGASPFASRKPHGTWTGEVYGDEPGHGDGPMVTAPTTEGARQWDGWGTATKPGHEPIVLARKPFAGTVAANVLEYGTGALNIGACRVDGPPPPSVPQLVFNSPTGQTYGMKTGEGRNGAMSQATAGRWPTNVVFSHSASCVEGQACEADCPVGGLDRQAPNAGGNSVGADPAEHAQRNTVLGEFSGHRPFNHPGGKGGASRFFPTFRYQAKAPASERPKVNGIAHSTVKPLALMSWLVRLVTPPGGTVLDPFAGSGTTLEAALLEGFQSIGIEAEPDYMPLIMARLSKAVQSDLFGADMKRTPTT